MATNSQVDTAAAAIAAPAGPLTRVTDLDSMNISDNRDVKLQFTTDASSPALGASYTVWLSYNELTSDAAITLIRQQVGIAYKMYDFVARLNTINTAAQALSKPYTSTMWQDLIGDLRSELTELRGF